MRKGMISISKAPFRLMMLARDGKRNGFRKPRKTSRALSLVANHNDSNNNDDGKAWSRWELFVSSAMALVVSGSFLANPNPRPVYTSNHFDVFGPGPLGGNTSNNNNKKDEDKNNKSGSNRSNGNNNNNNNNGDSQAVLGSFIMAALTEEVPQGEGDGEFPGPLDVSVRALRGNRLKMEDAYFVSEEGRVLAVFDGHGGGDVSSYLRDKFYEKLSEQHRRKQWEEQDVPSSHYVPSLSSHVSALRSALEKCEDEIMQVDSMHYQGSTAVVVTVHESEDRQRTLVSANLGDSRATLCRDGKAFDLTRDHKPGDEREKARILALGETIEWDPYAKVHRVLNLSLSRSIGDRCAKPVVSSEVEINQFPVLEGRDEFVILASDGLWDVMTSDEAVSFVKNCMDTSFFSSILGEEDIHRLKYSRRKNVSRYLANEALKLGSGDNICVLIVWLQPLEEFKPKLP